MIDIFGENILDHYRNPRNSGDLEKPDIVVSDLNPLCGDKFEFQIKLNGNSKIQDVKFKGDGCAISTASASMLTDEIKNKSLEDIRNMKSEKVFELLGIEVGPARINCALLPLSILKQAVKREE